MSRDVSDRARGAQHSLAVAQMSGVLAPSRRKSGGTSAVDRAEAGICSSPKVVFLVVTKRFFLI